MYGESIETRGQECDRMVAGFYAPARTFEIDLLDPEAVNGTVKCAEDDPASGDGWARLMLKRCDLVAAGIEFLARLSVESVELRGN